MIAIPQMLMDPSRAIPQILMDLYHSHYSVPYEFSFKESPETSKHLYVLQSLTHLRALMALCQSTHDHTFHNRKLHVKH